MKRSSREIETLVTTMFAAVPLYTSQTVLLPAVATFHVILGAIFLWLLAGKEPPRVSETGLRIAAILYLGVFLLDAVAVSRSLIGSSTHLLFFIAIYQALDSTLRVRNAQRLLVTFLIFITSISTSTSLAIVLFVLFFAFLAFRELIRLSHSESASAIGRAESFLPASRSAALYVIPTAIIAALLFPLMPRTQNPFVRGLQASTGSATTGISDRIDFRTARSISPDPEVIARVWMPAEALPFFSPVRLRARVYDRFEDEQWTGTPRRRRPIPVRDGAFILARPIGFTRYMTVQQRSTERSLLLVPDGTFALTGPDSITESTAAGGYFGVAPMQSNLDFRAWVSRQVRPLTAEPSPRLAYTNPPPQVSALARSIARDATTPHDIATRVEAHLRDTFSYVPDPAEIGRPISVEEFLLVERRGHCEYFAAGMVALMNSLGVPARIVGGFYGGDLNPLTRYFSIRKSDAHAWVEVFDGEKWRTYDPTPASLRPGNVSRGLVSAYMSAVNDYVGYVWDRYVLTFGLGDQLELFARAFESLRQSFTTARSAIQAFSSGRFLRELAPAVVIALFAAGIYLVVRRRRQPILEQLVELLERGGIAVRPSMTAGELREVAAGSVPALSPEIDAVVEYHLHERFSSHAPTRDMRSRAEQAIRMIRRELSRPVSGADAG